MADQKKVIPDAVVGSTTGGPLRAEKTASDPVAKNFKFLILGQDAGEIPLQPVGSSETFIARLGMLQSSRSAMIITFSREHVPLLVAIPPEELPGVLLINTPGLAGLPNVALLAERYMRVPVDAVSHKFDDEQYDAMKRAQTYETRFQQLRRAVDLDVEADGDTGAELTTPAV